MARPLELKKRVRARKRHDCAWCSSPIERGQRYVLFKSPPWDRENPQGERSGRWKQMKVHEIEFDREMAR